VYDIAFGWDPGPEIERLLFGCRGVGVEPRSALELGCGTGRLLRALAGRGPAVWGVDLDLAMVTYARTHSPHPENLVVADMSDFALGQTFDLLYASANTLRCVTDAADITRMWRCIAAHLRPGGAFVADLEVGFAAETQNVNRPVGWTMARGETSVRVTWTIIAPPSPATRCCRVEWVFEVQSGEPSGCWRESFPLRTYDAEEIVALATAGGLLSLHGLHLLRDPYLFETPPSRAVGRVLLVLRRT
jgi:SAM-dependent methyltransferase